MLRNAGIEAYDVAPSARQVPCPVVVCNERYERGDVLDDCECGKVTIDVIAVRETKSECLTAISSVIHVLREVDWEPWNDGRISISGMSVIGMPVEIPRDASGRFGMKATVNVEAYVLHER